MKPLLGILASWQIFLLDRVMTQEIFPHLFVFDYLRPPLGTKM